MDCDAVIVGAGLAGLVAANELADRGRTVVVLDQEGRQSLGGQAFWSLGGLFMVDTPEQRRLGVADSPALALADWMGTAAFDRPEDAYARTWAHAYVEFAAGEMRAWLRSLGMRWFPVVGWAERGGALAHGRGNSVPRFHLTWGTGPGVLAPFLRRILVHEAAGRVRLMFRHRVTGIERAAGATCAVTGDVLAATAALRGAQTNEDVVDDFRIASDVVIVAAGGLGGNLELVRRHWPVERLGTPPARMVCGVPRHVDGRMLGVAAQAGAAIVNADRMWHYPEGIRNWNPIWPDHGIRILPGPSPLWFDATGHRLPPPCLPGFDTLASLREICRGGHDHSWFVLTQSMIEKEFALSGSEQNADLTSARWSRVLRSRLGRGATPEVEAFKRHGADFVVAGDIDELVDGMKRIGNSNIEGVALRAQIEARDGQVRNAFNKDAQMTAVRGARAYLGDRLIRVARPHRIFDPAHGPLIAVRLHVLTRKSLGGLQTDGEGRVLDRGGQIMAGLYAIGEAAGFGGGGAHGYSALEGTFLGGCLFSGRVVGRAAA